MCVDKTSLFNCNFTQSHAYVTIVRLKFINYIINQFKQGGNRRRWIPFSVTRRNQTALQQEGDDLSLKCRRREECAL